MPASDDPQCREQVALLRSQGNRVVRGFPGQQVDFAEISCDRQLVVEDGHYVIKELS